tara:strand:- start:253402 stop:253590 length:189 start_codon:yes stop_codon:yes gene_type:complete
MVLIHACGPDEWDVPWMHIFVIFIRILVFLIKYLKMNGKFLISFLFSGLQYMLALTKIRSNI